MTERCAYIGVSRADLGRSRVDRRRRCRKPGSVTLETPGGGMSVGVCDVHAPIYLAHGWVLGGER